MALFNFGKKKEEKKAPACCCGSEPKAEESAGCCCGSAPKAEETNSCCCGGSAPKAEETNSCCCGVPAEGICCIKVLGAGCKSCHEQYENVRAAVKSVGLSAPVEYITDMEKVMAYGVMRMPAIVVNEQVVSMGRVLKAAEVEKLLRRLGH